MVHREASVGPVVVEEVLSEVVVGLDLDLGVLGLDVEEEVVEKCLELLLFVEGEVEGNKS